MYLVICLKFIKKKNTWFGCMSSNLRMTRSNSFGITCQTKSITQIQQHVLSQVHQANIYNDTYNKTVVKFVTNFD